MFAYVLREKGVPQVIRKNSELGVLIHVTMQVTAVRAFHVVDTLSYLWLFGSLVQVYPWRRVTSIDLHSSLTAFIANVANRQFTTFDHTFIDERAF